MNENNKEKIEEYGLAVFKGLITNIPVFGPLTVELLNVTIPNKRIERIEKLLKILQSNVSDIEENLRRKFKEDNFIDLYEDVLFQAIRATNDERLVYLASVLENGLKEENIEYLQTKTLLKIFNEINDEEVIILQSYSFVNLDNKTKFKEKHEAIFIAEQFQSISHTLNNKDDKYKKLAMLNHYKNHLIALELIGEYNESNDGFLITFLGAALLKLIGLDIESQQFAEPINVLKIANNLLNKIDEQGFNNSPQFMPMRRNLGFS